MLGTPVLDRRMRATELLVGSKMYGRGNKANRSGRHHHVFMAAEFAVQFDTDFQVNLSVPIKRNMSTQTLHALLLEYFPNLAASFWNHPGEFLGSGNAPDDGDPPTRQFLSVDLAWERHSVVWNS